MSKKTVTSETFYDEYGNPKEMLVVEKTIKDKMDIKGWRRVVLADMVEVLDMIGNKKIKVLEALLDNIDRNNEILLNQEEIAKIAGVSRKTVVNTIKSLAEVNFIKKFKGRYVVNNSIIGIMGNKQKNTMLCIKYGFEEKEETNNNTIEEADKKMLIQKALNIVNNDKYTIFHKFKLINEIYKSSKIKEIENILNKIKKEKEETLNKIKKLEEDIVISIDPKLQGNYKLTDDKCVNKIAIKKAVKLINSK